MEAIIKLISQAYDLNVTYVVISLVFIFLYKKLKLRQDRAKKDKISRISTMISEIERNSPLKYHFVVEQLFLQRFGVLIDYPAIKYFMKSERPSANFVNYVLGKKYVQFDKNYSSISYKEGYKRKRIGRLIKLDFFFYGVFSFVGLLIIFSFPNVTISMQPWAKVAYLLSGVCALIVAYIYIDDSVRLQSAIDLIEQNQNSRTINSPLAIK
ncbi:hypothetical protein M9194_11710 [Vibrio sp. S4M6]|uniref:hypothetical protein n=1 Tax=Vibrio sinus TaxID=2946865 RepID=UPI00202A7207|nr:hypothetical protein [Vibrio sinus]MCL9782093.1 hypothetical protein [Vibrio sinus]